MIKVKRTENDTDAKLVARFLRRVKLANIVARKRKTRYWVKPPSKLQKKKKLCVEWLTKPWKNF